MKICPITYDTHEDNGPYSRAGLKKISPKLDHLEIFPHSATEQRQEAQNLATKISIQGVQPKLSARLNFKTASFEIVERFGKFILKPQSADYPELPENEDLTMHLANTIGIETPLHGLLLCRDGSWSYFIKRMDRVGHSDKIHMEDFAQLAQKSRETKYDFIVEKLIKLIEQFTTFPLVEKEKFYRRFLFNFLVGNEDMHLKNYSIIRQGQKIELCPAYDFLNTSIALKNPREEIALPFRGKKNKLSAKDLLEELPRELELNQKTCAAIMQEFSAHIPDWPKWIERSFMSGTLKEKYLRLLSNRGKRLGLIKD